MLDLEKKTDTPSVWNQCKGHFNNSSFANQVMFLCFSDGKTRTKDKYRVVYTDHQRLELEKEFHYSKYITIRRKSELATTLGLSERQVRKNTDKNWVKHYI